MKKEYNKGEERNSPAYKKGVCVDMPITDIYGPLTRETGIFTDKPMDMLEKQSFQTIISNKHLKLRQENTNPLVYTDALDTFNSYTRKMEAFKHWSEPVRVLNETFKDKKVKDAIAQFHGTEYNRVMGWFIERFAGVDQRWQVEAMDRATGKLSKGILYLKPAIGIKQTFSTLLYAVDMPIRILTANICRFSANPKLL